MRPTLTDQSPSAAGVCAPAGRAHAPRYFLKNAIVRPQARSAASLL